MFGLFSLGTEVRREGADDFQSFQAHRDNLPEQTHDVTLVVELVGIALDAAARVRCGLILVDHPLQGGTIPELVVEALGRDAGEREGFVVGQCVFVSRFPAHLLDAQALRHAAMHDTLQGKLRGGFEPILNQAPQRAQATPKPNQES